jgi:hypothetical protein
MKSENMVKVPLQVSVHAPLGNEGAEVAEVVVEVDPQWARQWAVNRLENRYYDSRDGQEADQIAQTWSGILAQFEGDPTTAARRVVYQRVPSRPFASVALAEEWASGLGRNILQRHYCDDSRWFRDYRAG